MQLLVIIPYHDLRHTTFQLTSFRWQPTRYRIELGSLEGIQASLQFIPSYFKLSKAGRESWKELSYGISQTWLKILAPPFSLLVFICKMGPQVPKSIAPHLISSY